MAGWLKCNGHDKLLRETPVKSTSLRLVTACVRLASLAEHTGSLPSPSEYAVERGALEQRVLLGGYFKTLRGQEALNLRQSAFLIVNFDHCLADPVPMLGSDSLQNFQLAFLDVHFQQVDPRHVLLVDDFRERAQGAGKRLPLEQEAEETFGIAWRNSPVDHACFGGAAIRFQIRMESRHYRVGGVKSEFRGTRLAGQSALKNPGIGSMERDVRPQAFASRGIGFEGEDANALPFLMKENGGQSDVGADVEHTISILQLDAVLQVAARAEYFAANESCFIGVQGEYFQAIGESELSHHELVRFQNACPDYP